MKYKLVFFVFIQLILFSHSSQSAESNLCDKELSPPKYLKDVGIKAEKAKKEICTSKTNIDADYAYIDFLDAIEGWFSPYGGFEEDKNIVKAIKNNISIANTSVVVSLNLKNMIQVEADSFKPVDEAKCTSVSGAPSCTDVLEEFVALYSEIQNLQASKPRREILKNLSNLRSEWEPFLEHMKGQTWLELLVNRQVYKNNSDEFRGPPLSQWIVLHPAILIENVADAADGEETQEALGLEIIGMNWWKQDKWYVPSGASALAVYSDRAEIDDVGYGIAFHFLSDYTIGYTNHDGEDGIFVSVDLIKAFQDKKKVFESYSSVYD